MSGFLRALARWRRVFGVQGNADMSVTPNNGGETGCCIQLSEEEFEHAMRAILDHRAATQEYSSRYACPGEREEVGRRIKPETACVFFIYAQVLDPYGDRGLPEELDCVGREFFAADPEEGVAVSFGDLPEVTRQALEVKMRNANRKGWERVLGGLLSSGPRLVE